MSIEFNDRNLDTVSSFIKKVQVERKVPCIIFIFDVKIDLQSKFLNDEKIQFQSMLDSNPTSISACNIIIGNRYFTYYFSTLDGVYFIASNDFAMSPESMAIEKSTKNHIWIIKGTFPKGRFSWPVLEVEPKVSKLYCPGQDKAKLVMPRRVQTCPDYPTMNGKEVKASIGKNLLF